MGGYGWEGGGPGSNPGLFVLWDGKRRLPNSPQGFDERHARAS